MVNKANVGRFDGDLKIIAFNDGDNVQALLEKAGSTLGSGESVNRENGDNVNPTDTAINGETYWIVGNYKQGC